MDIFKNVQNQNPQKSFQNYKYFLFFLSFIGIFSKTPFFHRFYKEKNPAFCQKPPIVFLSPKIGIFVLWNTKTGNSGGKKVDYKKKKR